MADTSSAESFTYVSSYAWNFTGSRLDVTYRRQRRALLRTSINLKPFPRRMLLEVTRGLEQRMAFVEFWLAYVRVNPNADEYAVVTEPVQKNAQAVVPASSARKVALRQELDLLCGYGHGHLGARSWIKEAALVHHEMTVRLSEDATEVEVEDRTTHHRYRLGEYARAIALPGSMSKRGLVNDGTRLPSTVQTSPDQALVLCSLGDDTFAPHKDMLDQLEELNAVVRIRKKQVTLLQGPPGSGKEIFAPAIHYGSIRSGEYIPFAVPGFSLDQLREALFGSLVDGKIRSGLIEKARNGTLFLDEFDKPSTAEFYAMLLRVLESRVYYPHGSLEQREAENVNWVLAGAFDKTRGGAIPRDLWTRLTGSLELKNRSHDPRYVAALFLRFHFQEVLEKFKSKIDDKRVLMLLGVSNRSYRPNAAVTVLAHRFAEVVDQCRSRVQRSAIRVRNTRSSAPIPELSVRSIRQAAIAASQLLIEGADEGATTLDRAWNDKGVGSEIGKIINVSFRGEA
jgi:sigma-54 interacting transcriptional regulator